jgi:NAD(P)-dependent dehydrogenase (short-subunit alcohol dehydrogenase family)
VRAGGAAGASRRVALITGASQGIGAAIAKRLARPGWAVYVSYLTNRAGGEAVIEEIQACGGVARLLELDVADHTSVERAFAQVGEAHGRLDALVSNAVRDRSAPIAEQSIDDWRTMLAVKLDGIFLCTKAALPLFAASGDASLIAISSFEGEQPSPAFAAYGVAAAGVNAFVKAMALYLPRYGARCNAVCPGPVPTALWSEGRSSSEGTWSQFAAANPMSRNATPEDVAEAVAMLVHDPTRYLNGNFVYVNGGNHLRSS